MKRMPLVKRTPEDVAVLNTWINRLLYDRLKTRARLERRTMRTLTEEALKAFLSKAKKK